jgi:hypothetical protein
LSPRTLLWIVVLIAAAVLVYRLRSGGTEADRALARAAIPTATEYARDVVSPTRCRDAAELADRSLGDPCDAFAALHGLRLGGSGRIVRGCSTAPEEIRDNDRVRGADCVAFTVAGRGRRGTLSVWLRQSGDRWIVASAASELHST